jgi:recombinational DNA repair protein (RecF pathway)
MYQKYQTEAVVMGSRESGENDRAIALFTREFGLVWAKAIGVRKETSKMRCAVPLYARAQVALVRGKHGWRLAGAISLGAPPRARTRSAGPSGLSVFARIASLTLKLVGGEEQNVYLYDTLTEAHSSLTYGCEAGSTIELLCVARVLYALGYLSADALGTSLFAHTAFAEPHMAEATELRDPLLASVNNALSAAHL